MLVLVKMNKTSALIKWVGGKDDGLLTPEVPLAWVLSFDQEKWANSADATSSIYAIIWKTTKKEPSSGWPCYNGRVMLVGK